MKKEYYFKAGLKDIAVGVVFLLFLYQDALACHVSKVFTYFDELEAVAAFMFFIIYCAWNGFAVPVKNKKLILAFGAFLLCGILGNFKSGFQTLGYILLDLVTCSKLFLNFVLFQKLFCSRQGKNIEQTVYLISRISIVILFLLVIHEYIFPPIFPYLEDRYNIHSLKLFFSNQTYLAETGIYLLLTVTVVGKRNSKNRLLKIMAICIAASTMRTKALGFLAVYIMFQVIPAIRNKRKIFFCLWIAGILCIAVGHEYIYYYFLGESARMSPRKMLLMDSIDIAKRYFPVGSGFGTFCSGAANLSGSRIYTEYYGNRVYPFNDMFWACVIGQFGFLGFCFFLKCVYEIIISIINCRGTLKESYYGMLLYVVYLLIATLGECSFFAPYSNLFGLTIGYFISTRRYEEIRNMIEKYLPLKTIRGGVEFLPSSINCKFVYTQLVGCVL
ncbi:MAG: hypothetical protein HFH49_17070 [Lachnospiraceae bacterium]|nr:hypothetical protein [Lachnospiraceae bacterium]